MPEQGLDFVVTIDGPSGVGKSTISRRLAARLAFAYLDTGAMYRAVALHCLELGVSIDNGEAVANTLDAMDLRLLPAANLGEDVGVVLNGRDVGEQIRVPEISMLASRVSALGLVRDRLTNMQRAMGACGRMVAEGRDTGTMVFPGARFKFYLTADPEERARRRIGQLRKKGADVDEERIIAEIIKRDREDSERTLAPLKAAPDAVTIDSTTLQADEVVILMIRHIEHSL